MSKRELDTLDVGTLIKMLKNYPDTMPVVFAHPSHDYWRTELAGEIGELEEGAVKYTGYHEGFKTTDPDPDDEKDDGAEIIPCLVIR